MAAMHFDETTAQTIISLVEKHKDELSEGEYVKLCNASKYVHDHAHAQLCNAVWNERLEEDNETVWWYNERTDEWWPDNREPHWVRNPFWRTGPDMGMSYVPAYTNERFSASEDNLEIMRLEYDIGQRENEMEKNKNIMKKKSRVTLTDKYNVLSRVIIQNPKYVHHHVPPNVKSMSAKVSYYEELIKTKSCLAPDRLNVTKKDYEREKEARIEYQNKKLRKENRDHARIVKEKKEKLLELRS